MTNAPTPAGERQVRALPFIATSAFVLTIAAVIFVTRPTTPAHPAVPTHRLASEPTPVRDVDHYVPGSPPAVAERFLRAWMRARYDEARDLATGAMRERAEHEVGEVGGFNSEQMEEYRRTRAYVNATNYDLEHIEISDLPPADNGHPRKRVLGQAHAYGSFDGTRVDSQRGQTFVLEMVDGAWRVAERTWETFDRQH